MSKRLWIVLAVLVVAAVGGLIWWKNSQSDTASYVDFLDGKQVITTQSVVDAKNKAANNGELAADFQTDKSNIIPDHIWGKKDSKVIVVQYEDFACSACNAFATTAHKIMTDYEDRVLFIYRHFNLGQNTSTLSESAAEAAFLLGGEGKFWQMHELIFSDETCVENNDKNTCQERLYSYAEQLGLDMNKFKSALSDYRNNGINDKLQRDKALGVKAGVSATPTWFVDGKEVKGASDSDMRSAIDDALKNADKK